MRWAEDSWELRNVGNTQEDQTRVQVVRPSANDVCRKCRKSARDWAITRVDGSRGINAWSFRNEGVGKISNKVSWRMLE